MNRAHTEQGAVMVLMLAVVLLLSLGIGVSAQWVETGMISIRRAEDSLVAEESMIAAIRIASIEIGAGPNCASWAGGSYPINDREVAVSCREIDQNVYLHAELGHRWLRAEVRPATVLGERWQLIRWVWET